MAQNSIERIDDEQWLRERYWEDGKSIQDIADELDTYYGKVYKKFLRMSIDRRTNSGTASDKLKDPEWLREKYHDEGMTLSEISELTDCTTMTVWNYMDRHGIETDGTGRTHYPELHDEESARALYEEHGTVTGVADEVGCSYNTAYDCLNEHGVDTGQNRPDYSDELTEDAFLEWLNEGMNAFDIADEVGCSASTVYYWAKKYGLKGELREYNDPDEVEDPEWLREKYHDEGLSMNDIADEVGVSTTKVQGRLKELGIEVRSRSKGGRHKNETWLRSQLRKKGKSYAEVAEETEVTQNTVRHWARKLGV